MFGLSIAHILILLVVILLFGGKRLPELGSALGKGLRSFRKGLEGIEDLASQEPLQESKNVKTPDAVLSEKSRAESSGGTSTTDKNS